MANVTFKNSGELVKFLSASEAPIRHLKVYFKPQQAGTGDPSPSNMREITGWTGVSAYKCRKNLLSDNVNDYKNNVGAPDAKKVPSDFKFQNGEYSGTVPNATRDYCVYAGQIAIPPGTYTLSFDYINGVQNYSWKPVICSYDNTSSNWYSGITSPAANQNSGHIQSTFTATKPFYVNIALNSFANTSKSAVNKLYNLQLEYGSTATAYEPYIGQSLSTTFPVLGKNKFDKATVTSGYRYRSNGVVEEKEGWCVSDYIPVVAGQTYTITTSGSFGIHGRNIYYDANKEKLSVAAQYDSSVPSFTVPSGAAYIRLSLYEEYLDITQLELGSSATTYEPYNPNHTVYGGWVDLISGEVASTYIHCKIKDLPGEWNYRSANNRFQIALTDNYANAASSGGIWTHFATSEVYKTSTSNGYGNKQIATYIDKHIYIRDDDFEGDLEAFLNGVGDTYITYELAESTTYSLSPTEMQTFLGQNNVWSNADYVEVEYDLHETQDILARKQFIVANQPHIVKPAAAPLQNFVTDMVAPLKECKVHFEPVQEGSGNPSPNNVRVINGWTGVKAWRVSKNLIDESYLADGDNYPNAGGYGYYYTNDIQLAPNTRYRFVWYNYDNTALSELGTTNIHLYVSGASEYIVDNADYRQYSSGFITSATGIIRLGIYHTSALQRQDILDAIFNNGKLLLQVGIDDIAYEPYNGTTLPIDWTTEAGTVYGGYVDLVTGEVWKTWDGVTLDGNQKAYISGTSYRGTNCTDIWFDAGSDNWGYYAAYNTISLTDSYCDSLILKQKGIWGNPDLYSWSYVLNSYNQIHCVFDNSTVGITSDDTNAQAITKVKSWLASHPITVKYRLSDSKAILITTLTPIQLKTLRGQNNIWSTANDVIKLSYWSH